VRPIRFPVEGTVSYTDDFGAPRGDHTHQGNDLLGVKLQRELAAADGVVTYRKLDPAGNILIITDAEGWTYWYIHINNDTPGTDDGLNPPEWAFAPGVVLGARVFAGQFVAYMGDSGDAESTAPHLHFELHPPGSAAVDPYFSLQAARTKPDADQVLLGGTIYGYSTPYWSLRNSVTAGTADIAFPYGGAGDVPLACDWDGDGVDTPVIYRANVFYARNSNTPGIADVTVKYGRAGDIPLCGDWDGDGIDTVGVYRSGVFYLRNRNKPGFPALTVRLGQPGDIPVTGDWNGDGTDGVGVVHAAIFTLRNVDVGGPDMVVPYGDLTDRPLVGDWDGDGIDTVAIYRAGSFYLRDTNTTGAADLSFAFGGATATPLVGDWNRNLTDTVGAVTGL
jgi:hypothetical protein